MSTTMSTLNGLRMKGVKVELGIPEDLWNATSAETSKLKRQCDKVGAAAWTLALSVGTYGVFRRISKISFSMTEVITQKAN